MLVRIITKTVNSDIKDLSDEQLDLLSDLIDQIKKERRPIKSTLSQRQDLMAGIISQSTIRPLYQSEALNWLPVYDWLDNILGKDELIHVDFTPQDHDWEITALVHLTVKCKDGHTFTDTRGLFQYS